MAFRHLETLRLDPQRVQAAAGFFEDYASYIAAQPPAANGDETALADVATALRIAGQWSMLIDMRRASELLGRSAEIWYGMQYGFGAFVLAAVAPDRLTRSDLTRSLAFLARPLEAARRSSEAAEPADEQQPTPAPLLHPQQQGYLLLAGVAMGRRLDIRDEIPRVIAERSPHRRGVAPMGALGTPLRVYWHIADSFLTRGDQEAARLMASDLASMAATYARVIDAAMANELLWSNAAAPVDVADLDIAAIAVAGARRLGPDVTKYHLQIAAEGLNATARVPMELALEMIDAVSQVDTDNLDADDS
jgi:hypothetical protein